MQMPHYCKRIPMRATYSHVLALGFCLALAAAGVGQTAPEAARRPRAREIGVAPGIFDPGPLNAITDLDGVRVGQVTVVQGDDVRTGVTAILPHPGNLFQEKVTGGVFVGNAFGKLAGATQVAELGTIETPIVLTNTLNVGAAVEAVVAYTLALPGNAKVRSVNALAGETNDGTLNDIRGMHVQREHVLEAIRKARGGPVEEGSVGAGTGTICFGWKGGIGTSSRKLPARYGGYTVGVLVQTNFGGVLTIAGAPVGKELGRYAFARASGEPPQDQADLAGGSCMIIVATDAPIDARDCRRLAARALFGLARTGSSYSNGSGDFAIAFTTAPSLRVRAAETAPQTRTILPSEAVSPLFQAALEATEEAVYNSLLRATPVSSRGRTVEAIPVERVVNILRKYGAN